MGLSGLTLMAGATSMSVTGGTSTAYVEDGVDVKNGIHLIDSTEADFTIQANATFKNRNPQLQADGTYTKAKRQISLVFPATLADGTTTFNVARIDVEIHPEMSAAVRSDLILQAAQCLTDADTQDFLTYGSLA